jgi:hypothetical protein
MVRARQAKGVVQLAPDDASTTAPETCRVLGISNSSYYAALRGQRRFVRRREISGKAEHATEFGAGSLDVG